MIESLLNFYLVIASITFAFALIVLEPEEPFLKAASLALIYSVFLPLIAAVMACILVIEAIAELVRRRRA